MTTEDDNGAGLADSVAPEPVEPETPVPARLQRRNLICYSTTRMLMYLAAPMTYVDVMHGTLIDKMGGSRLMANLPTSVNLWMTLSGVFVAWLIPDRRLVRRVAVTAFSLEAILGAVVGLALFLPTGDAFKIALLLLHAIVLGACGITAEIYTWEILSKSMSREWRGRTLGLAFGIGPLFAVLGSIGADYILKGKIAWLSYPHDYALCFALTAPILGSVALIARAYFVPPTPDQKQRPPLLTHIFGGLWDFMRQRQFYLLIAAYLISYVAWMVYVNGSLNIRNVLGVEPKEYAGTIQALRFGGKMVAGFLLGFLAARRGAKAGALATLGLTGLGVLWLVTAQGMPYLGAFALFGAGELAGVYFPNYCVSASQPEQTKRNLSFLYLTGLLVGPIPALHGLVADRAGFRASFLIALVAAAVAIMLAAKLPYRAPRKR